MANKSKGKIKITTSYLPTDSNQPARKVIHSVSKSQKKSHSTLRAKRATFNFGVDEKSLKMPKMAHFGKF